MAHSLRGFSRCRGLRGVWCCRATWPCPRPPGIYLCVVTGERIRRIKRAKGSAPYQSSSPSPDKVTASCARPAREGVTAESPSLSHTLQVLGRPSQDSNSCCGCRSQAPGDSVPASVSLPSGVGEVQGIPGWTLAPGTRATSCPLPLS